jgi:hypothetical protein
MTVVNLSRRMQSVSFSVGTVAVVWLGALTSLLGSGCVPRERPEESSVASAPSPAPAAAEAAPISTPPPAVAVAEPALAAGDPMLTAVFTDDFNRTGPTPSDLGPHWRATSSAWTLSDGRLCGENARNHPVWLRRRLSKNASIEFQASSASSDGDIKAEFWGDGRSSASGQSYTDATSYLTVFGGWKNSFHVLARIDEHARDRQEIKLVPGGADFIRSTVVPHQVYQFQVERRDGHTVKWRVDDMEILTYRDAEPLAGPGHEHFGFNDWQARLCFDNLRVTPLQD